MADLDDIKVILRSILTSFPGTATIFQLIQDYEKLEGSPLPFRELGFNTVFELLKTMNDVFKMPLIANMNSSIEVILDKKSCHIRELVENQKNRKPQKNVFKKSSNFFHTRISRSYRHNNIYPSNFNARGYDFVQIKSYSSPKPKGRVTNNLQSHIEYLCNSSESNSISLSRLKTSLLEHPDYEELGAINLENAINMLKYFIYIDKGRVYLKDSSYEIFPHIRSELNNSPKTEVSACTQYILNEDEISDDDIDNDYGLSQDFFSSIEESKKSSFNHLQSQNCDSIEYQRKKEDPLKTASVLTKKPLNNDMKLKIGLEEKSKNSNILKKSKVDYTNDIISIISTSKTPMTVKEVMDCFKSKFGYSFPIEKLSCRTCMDYFRLHPDLFELNQKYSTNSIVTLKEKIILVRKSTFRKNLINASILNNQAFLENWNNKCVFKSHDSSLIRDDSNHQKPKDNIGNINFTESLDLHDSEMVSESMKQKLCSILLKYDNGIPCNEFMDIFSKEYNCQFSFDEYGFKSMKDMAYRLPSVFHVKIIEDECILFHACKRKELDNEDNLSDSSEYYKKIPKTIIYNLAKFFENHRFGIKFDKLMTLYCSEHGKSYEPLKYGYSSERHMFESLNKMVEIRNDVVYTKDPYAYTYFLKCEESINNYSSCISVSMDKNFLMNYSGKDICNGTFKYPKFQLSKEKLMKIVVAEIYNPSSFYIQIASRVPILNTFMDNLQEVYDKHGDLYTVLPELITPHLVCTACFENGPSWHRAVILKIVDEHSVQVLYVDFGSIEIISKSKIRLLKSEFGDFPIQSLHCSLYDHNNILETYSRDISEYFAQLVDGKLLEANFKNSIFKGNLKRMVVTLYSPIKNGRININKKCLNEIKILSNKCDESIRRIIFKFLQDNDEPQE